MDIVLSESAKRPEIIAALHQCTHEDAVCCTSEALFLKAKKLLIEEKRKNVTIQLLDADGYAIRQVSSKPKNTPKDQLTGRQIAIIRALEKVLKHCRQEGIQLVGYSDELVAMPAHISIEEISSAGALDVNCHDVYKGADAIAPESTL